MQETLSILLLLDLLVFVLFGELMKYIDSVPLCYLDFVSVVCVSCGYLPSGPANLENVLETRAVLLAQK